MNDPHSGLPQLHVDPDPRGVQATAPYNFIPLPHQVLRATEALGLSSPGENGGEVDRDDQPAAPWRNHHRILADHHSGYLDLRITTKSPTYTRGACLLVGEADQDNPDGNDPDWDRTDPRQRSQPMLSADERAVPILPGSSIRGAIRTVFEILTSSKLTPVTDKASFYRSLPPERIGKFYQQEMVNGDQKPAGGFLVKTRNGWQIQRADVATVRHDVLKAAANQLPEPFRYEFNPRYSPQDRLHRLEVWVRREAGKVTHVYRDEVAGTERGRLVLTGGAPKKKNEFVFFEHPGRDRIDIPNDVWDAFNSDRQISQWQERRFERSPNGDEHPDGTGTGPRPIAGAAAAGDPVFYLLNPDGSLRFFGRARMFRLPYDRSPAQMLPADHAADGPLDMAQALFGTVGGSRAVKGRLSFSTAVADGEPPEDGWLHSELVPKMLSSPKPTSYPHYLVQDGNAGKEHHATYLADDTTTLRGNKLYWHRPTSDAIHLARDNQDSVEFRATVKAAGEQGRAGRMHTVIRPVRTGVVFRGRIRFTNLADIELGALLTAVDLPAGHAHHIGMGKSLGLGSVRLDATVHLNDPDRRYRLASDTAHPSPSAAHEVAAACRQRFEEVIVGHGLQHDEPTTDLPGLRQLARLDALHLMLDLNGAPRPDHTDHLPLDRFRDRRVLPSPHGVMGRSTQRVPLDRRPIIGEPPPPPPRAGRGDRGGPNRWNRRGGPGQRGRSGRPAPPRPAVAQTVAMQVSNKTTRKGAPILRHESGEYVFTPNGAPPEPVTAGDTVQVDIVSRASGPNRGQVRYKSDDVQP